MSPRHTMIIQPADLSMLSAHGAIAADSSTELRMVDPPRAQPSVVCAVPGTRVGEPHAISGRDVEEAIIVRRIQRRRRKEA